MEKVRIGIIGLGGMGANHAKTIIEGKVPNAELSSICDVNPERLKWARENLGENIKTFDNLDEFLASEIDGVIVATIHYYHPPIAIKALEKGLHVLIEKPAGVYTKQVREMNEVAKKSGKVFSIMYNQRTSPFHRKIKEIVRSGELGDIKRITWIVTNWYRPQSYYDLNNWRGTWKGEGGGILLNQGIHQLDIWQWIFGMPKRIRAFLGFGKYHNIEVEDEAIVYMEYENKTVGLFITSTAEAPGTNRLEIIGDNGTIIFEDEKIAFWKLDIPEPEFREKEKNPYSQPTFNKYEILTEGEYLQHRGILINWVESILKGAPLIAPGEEGINALMITNASYLSSWLDSWVDLPLDDDLYYEKLKERIC